MASRCISTLNDLDKISNRIYHKHSKGRFRAGIEAKLKASREKAERSLREIDEGSLHSNKNASSNRASSSTSSATLSSKYFSTSASTTSRSVTSERQTKTPKDKTSKSTSTKSSASEQRDQVIQRRKTKSCPSCSVASNKEESSDCRSDIAQVPRTASVFGKYNGKGSEYKPTAWFNLPQGTSVGVIDSFACDAKKEKPLCYSINVKKGESVPNLLRHNLEVRVGQNGVIRTVVNKRNTAMSELGDEDVQQGKKRTAPLSWDEQLHWQNACVISSERQTDGNSSSEGLCETHPVIFHEKKSEQGKATKRSEEKNHSPAYKLGLESRCVYADRRNLVSTGDKCITSVEIEDSRLEDDAAVCTERKERTQYGAGASGKERTRSLNAEEKIPKKVSFEDEGSNKRKDDRIKTKEESGENEVRNVEEIAPIYAQTDNTTKAVFADNRKIRAKTSIERSRRDDEEATKDVRKLRRPHTAPPAPPSSPRLYSESRLYNCIPMKIPTSQGEENQTNDENQKIVEFRSESSTPEDEKQNGIEDEELPLPAFSVQISPSSTSSPEKDVIQDAGSVPKKQVSFSGCKSAPVSRTVSRHQEGSLPPRAKSSTALHRSTYKPAPPVVIESESSLELSKDLPPAQALVALRKKIRDDLANQNRELQLDIQQLYLRKHSE